jgi:hypothetical protein
LRLPSQIAVFNFGGLSFLNQRFPYYIKNIGQGEQPLSGRSLLTPIRCRQVVFDAAERSSFNASPFRPLATNRPFLKKLIYC